MPTPRAPRAHTAAVALTAIITLTLVGGYVLFLDDRSELTPASGDATFERLLSLIPRTPDAIASVELIDYGRLYLTIGLDLPSHPLSEEEVPSFEGEVVNGSVRSGARFSVFVTRLGEYALVGQMTRPARMGYSMAEVRGHVYAGRDLDAFSEDRAFEAVVGSFDGDAVSRSISVCDDCRISPEFSTYGGVRYVAWGEDFRNHLRIRYAAPAFDNLGKGGRLTASGSYVLRTNWSEGMEAMIDVAQGLKPSLADDPYFASDARALDSAGVVVAHITCNSFSIEDVRHAVTQYATNESQWERDFEFWVQSSLPALRPFLLTGTRAGFEGGEDFVVVVLAHQSAEDAIKNVGRLKTRLKTGTNSRGTSWVSQFTTIDVKSEGNLVIARLGGSFDYLAFLYESLLIREE